MTSIRIENVPYEAPPEGATSQAGSPYALCREIRRIVFTEGQGVSLDLEFDGLDEGAEHFLAWRRVGTTHSAIGTARMRRIGLEAKVERVAVLEEERGFGVGRALMGAVEARARALGSAAIVLHAQVSVIPFYERLGYRAHGEVFVEAEIDHRSMSKGLALEPTPSTLPA